MKLTIASEDRVFILKLTEWLAQYPRVEPHSVTVTIHAETEPITLHREAARNADLAIKEEWAPDTVVTREQLENYGEALDDEDDSVHWDTPNH